MENHHFHPVIRAGWDGEESAPVENAGCVQTSNKLVDQEKRFLTIFIYFIYFLTIFILEKSSRRAVSRMGWGRKRTSGIYGFLVPATKTKDKREFGKREI